MRFVSGDEEGCFNMGLLREFTDQIIIRVQVPPPSCCQCAPEGECVTSSVDRKRYQSSRPT